MNAGLPADADRRGVVPERTSFRAALVAERVRLGLQRHEIASCCGVNASKYQSWEDGVAVPTRQQFKRLVGRLRRVASSPPLWVDPPAESWSDGRPDGRPDGRRPPSGGAVLRVVRDEPDAGRDERHGRGRGDTTRRPPPRIGSARSRRVPESGSGARSRPSAPPPAARARKRA